MTRTARCCCGAASITVEGEPQLNAICNCQSCRRRTGSAFGWSAYFPDEAVTGKTGETRIYAKDGAAGYHRHFCTRCGTTLYWKSFGFMPGATGIAGGCFADDPIPEPVASAADAARYPWIAIPGHWFKAPT
jgi:hypothetical protein